MNYFAHAYEHLEDPYFVAGTAVPDWMNVVDRSIRIRRKHATPSLTSSDRCTAAIAGGLVQHLDDDHWFHQTPAFAELSLKLTVAARDALAPDDGFRPSFLGHILVEIVLDAVLIERQPEHLDRYYDALARVEPPVVADVVGQMAGRPVSLLVPFITRFIDERFLPDYLDDEKLLGRLNQVMRRVKLPRLPGGFCDVIAEARRSVASRKEDLLPLDRS